MATGDKPNSNLFETNFNNDDKDKDKEKEAQLVAQNVLMGAGETLYRGATGIQDIVGMQGVPQGGTLDPIQGARDLLIGRQFNRGEPVRISDMGSLIQEPGTSAFSMEAAGQVKPMMQAQNLESFAQPQVTFRDYDVPETPRASALSVFTPGGEVKPDIDVNAITQSPEMISPNAVNTALNQDVVVGSPDNNDPSLMSKLSSILYPSGSVGGSGGAGLPPTFTPPSAGATQAQEGTDITPVTLESLGLESSGQRILKEAVSPSGITQAPSGVADLASTPSVTPPAESLAAGAQEQVATLDPTSDEAILARRAQREAQFSPQGLMGQDATRAALGGMTLNEYLNAPAGTEGVSGLRTDPQGRMIPGSNTVGGPTTRAEAFPDYEREVERAQARLSERDIRPGESQAQRDTRIQRDQSIVSEQAEGMSFDDAKRRAKGILAERNVQNPSASQVNALAISIQQGEPERLAELETKRAKDAVDLKTAQATLDRPEFEGRVYTVNGVTFAQTSRGGAQVIDTGTETSEESTAKMKDFVFALEQIDKARKAYQAGDVNKANDIITAAGIQKNGFDVTASEYFGGLTQQQEANITRQAFDTIEEAEAANLPKGTKITIGGRNATV